MKRLNKVILAAAAAFAVTALLPAGYAFSAEKMSAVVVFVSGDVKFKRAAVPALAELKLNEALQPGDTIVTGAGAKASLVTKTGAEIRINENSTFSIPGKSKVREMFDLSVGQVWGRMLHKMAKLNVRTPTAVCAVRGTEADIEQRSLLTVKVYEGHVDMENAAGMVSLKAGEMTSVSGAAAAPVKAAKMKPAEFGKWQDGVTSKDIMSFLEQLQASPGGDKKLRFNVGELGKSDKDVRIKLKKKDGAE